MRIGVRGVSKLESIELWTRTQHGGARAAQCSAYGFDNIDLAVVYVAVAGPHTGRYAPLNDHGGGREFPDDRGSLLKINLVAKPSNEEFTKA